MFEILIMLEPITICMSDKWIEIYLNYQIKERKITFYAYYFISQLTSNIKGYEHFLSK